MKTQEVTRNDWQKLCQRINEWCHGAMTTIKVAGLDGTSSDIAADVSFRSVSLDEHSDRCNDQLIIETGSANADQRLRHIIKEPIHIRLKNGQGARFNCVYILAEEGTTILTLNPGLAAEALSDLRLA